MTSFILFTFERARSMILTKINNQPTVKKGRRKGEIPMSN